MEGKRVVDMHPVWRLITASRYVGCAPHVLAEGPDEYIDWILAHRMTEVLVQKKQSRSQQ